MQLASTFMFPCIISIITTYYQQDVTILIYLLLITLHVSDDVFAHHQ